jgi:hypothetical protein
MFKRRTAVSSAAAVVVWLSLMAGGLASAQTFTDFAANAGFLR